MTSKEAKDRVDVLCMTKWLTIGNFNDKEVQKVPQKNPNQQILIVHSSLLSAGLALAPIFKFSTDGSTHR